jgi:hypothetical protein
MWPIQLDFLYFPVYKILASSPLYNNSFFTWSVQLISSILLQHHISKLPSYFSSIFQSVQISAPYKARLWLYHSISLYMTCVHRQTVLNLVQLQTDSFWKKIWHYSWSKTDNLNPTFCLLAFLLKKVLVPLTATKIKHWLQMNGNTPLYQYQNTVHHILNTNCLDFVNILFEIT